MGRRCGWMVLGVALLAGGASAAPPCEYLLGYARGAAPHVEWRLVDPLTGADTLMFVLPGEPVCIDWASLPRVDIVVGREVWRGEWRFESPRLVARMPDSIPICTYADLGDSRWSCTSLIDNDTIKVTTVWKSPDGFHWVASRPDTQPSEEPESCDHYWCELSGVEPPLEDRAVLISGRSYEEGPDLDSRWYQPATEDTTRGFEYSFRYDEIGGTPETIAGPVFWVDHRRGRRVQLVKEGAVELRRACGVIALTSDDSDVCRILDPSTGRALRTVPRGAIWVPRPRP